MKGMSASRRAYNHGMKFLLYLCAGITCALLIFLISYIFYRGLPNISWSLLSTQSSYINDTIGILPNILNTLYIILVALAVVLPLGVGAAIYLTEYAKSHRLVALIEYAAETLSGLPSILFGLVGMLFFIQIMGLQQGILAGGLTLVLMILPTIMRTTQESLKTVPQSYREGALALGARKWRMVRTVVLPVPQIQALGLKNRFHKLPHFFRSFRPTREADRLISRVSTIRMAAMEKARAVSPRSVA